MTKPVEPTSQFLKTAIVLPLLLIVVCLLLYGYKLGVPPIWLDEAYSWMYATGTWAYWWEGVRFAEDCGGFLFTLLLKLWIPVFGTGEAAMRWLPVLISVGTLLILFAAHRRLLGPWPAFYGSLLLMLHPLMIQYSRLLRSYSLLIFAAAFLLWGISRYVQNQERSVRDQLMISLGCLLATVSHVFGIFLLGGVGIGYLIDALFSGRWKKLFSGWLLLLPVAAWFVIWVKLMEKRVHRNLDDFWIQAPINLEYQYLIDYLGFYSVIFLTVALLVFLFLWMTGKVRYQNDAVVRYAVWTLPIGAAILFCPLLASWFSRGTHHFVNYRYCLAILPFLATWLILTVHRVPMRVLWLPVLIFLLIPFHFYFSSGQFSFYQNDYPFGLDMRRASEFLKSQPTDDPVFITPYGHLVAFQYYEVPHNLVSNPWKFRGEKSELPSQFLVVTCTASVEESGLFKDEVEYESLARFSQIEILRARLKMPSENPLKTE